MMISSCCCCQVGLNLDQDFIHNNWTLSLFTMILIVSNVIIIPITDAVIPKPFYALITK
jgi:hypothetical protein